MYDDQQQRRPRRTPRRPRDDHMPLPYEGHAPRQEQRTPPRPRSESTGIRENFRGTIGDTQYQFTLVHYYEDGKTLVYRRHRNANSREWQMLDPRTFDANYQTLAALELEQQGWPLRVISLFLGTLAGPLPGRDGT